jgi:hypothetical protein
MPVIGSAQDAHCLGVYQIINRLLRPREVTVGARHDLRGLRLCTLNDLRGLCFGVG